MHIRHLSLSALALAAMFAPQTSFAGKAWKSYSRSSEKCCKKKQCLQYGDFYTNLIDSFNFQYTQYSLGFNCTF